MVIDRSSFHDYFLKKQEEGYEVYVSEKVAMVVHDDGTIALQKCGCWPGEPGAVLLPRSFMDEDTKEVLAKIRQPSNKKGFNDDLTDKLNYLFLGLCRWHGAECDRIIEEELGNGPD